MWERWIRLKEARLALRAKNFEEAYRRSLDPAVREHRRAADVRRKAARELLARARRLRDQGDVVRAMEDVRFLLSAGERSEEALSLDGELRRALDGRRETERAVRRALDAARRKIADGDLDAARDGLASLGEEAPEARALLRDVERRVREADHAAAAARAAVSRGRVDEAKRRLADLASLAPRHPDLADLENVVREKGADEAIAGARDLLRKGRIHESRKAIAEARALGKAEEAGELADALAAAAEKAVAKAIDDGRFADAKDLLPAWAESPRATARVREVSAGLDSLARGLSLRETGALREAQEIVGAARASLPRSARIAAIEKEIAATASEVERSVEAANDALKKGDAAGARARLDAALRLVPGHRAVLAQRRLLDEAARAEREKFERAEEALASGRLEEARFLCLAIAASSPARPPRVDAVLEEADRRRDESRAALLEAEKTLASGTAGEADLRLAEERLRRVADGHRDWPALEEAVERLARERCVRDALARAAEAERRGEPAEAIRRLRDAAVESDPRVRVEAERLLGPALRARIAAVEKDLAARRPEPARRAAEEALAEAVPGSPEAERLASLLETAAGEIAAAGGFRDEVRSALRTGDYGAANAAIERLERVAPGAIEQDDLRSKLDACRSVEEALGGTRASGGEDMDRIVDRLKRSPGDRSLLFHIRRRAGRRSGRVGPRFVLRVEEAGECLVVSHERVTIGSVAGRDADLRVMANVGRLHAAIERGFDFHSGVEYRLKSLDGRECRVNGKVVADSPLGSGDEIALGPDLRIRFELPSEKSASARLTFAPGFGVDGVERVILLKADGADGRIVLASSDRAHVPVAHLRREVELYVAAGLGDLVCHSLAGVEVDGEGGRAEEKLFPGCYVRSGEVCFSVQSA